ncbi:uncharacterized protein LOC123316918 [Coccinella septempunctata]|uniref:uncharacterized protein LOC123316918 n=1 Tax=Coccinella septempunctata TaxID=41139 RepID=UPI001D0744E4|nr:uncharacterized protein LOC123316918 [Coccinella septempunctata]
MNEKYEEHGSSKAVESKIDMNGGEYLINFNENIETKHFEIHVNHLNYDQQSIIDELIQQNLSVFAKDKYDVGTVSGYEAHIDLLEEKYCSKRPYRCTIEDRKEIEQQIAKLLDKKLIEESYSPFAAPVTLALKRDENKRSRLCIDFRDLNKIVVPQSQPFPLIEDLTEKTRDSPITRSKTQGGRELQAGSLRNRPEDRSVGGVCGASGAPLREGTARPSPASPQGESPASLGVQTVHSAVRRPQRDRRMRWSKEDNCMVMRAHFIAMDLVETRNTTYRSLLMDIWKDICPDRPVYAQLLSNRVRWILDNQKLSRAELEYIKNGCYPGIIQQEDSGSSQATRARSSIGIRKSGLYVREREPNAVESSFVGNLVRFSGGAADRRPKIPRLKYSRSAYDLVREVNSILSRYSTDVSTFGELVDMVYAGAVTVCESLGQRIGCHQSAPRAPSTPPWKLRLEQKITAMRKKIGVIHTYLNSASPTSKVIKSVRRVASESRIKRRDPSFKEKLAIVSDHLKQKIKALGNRIRRYNERVKRYRNNNLYYRNRRRFFRSLDGDDKTETDCLEPKAAHEFWSSVWSRESAHDEKAYWIEEVRQRIPRESMDAIMIQPSDIGEVLKRSNNWAAPGSDKLHNYWWKYFNSVQDKLALLLQEALNNPASVPGFFTQGITYLIPKDGDRKDPKNYRPITCLSSVYKILTGVLTKYINGHIRKHHLMTEEQGGCRERSKGCKELLVIDHVVTKQARKKLRNISVAWVDYKKAFDSVPHTWLLKVLEMHGVSPGVIELLRHLMKTWRTTLFVRSGDSLIESGQIKIARGIFQGDTLSPIWFCLALNPLSIMLKNTKYGYVINKSRQIAISHRLFMDDLKLYGANSDQLRRMLELVAAFSESIGMEMGVEKCAVLDVRRGRIENAEEAVVLMNNTEIPVLDEGVPYKYLGIKQALEIKTQEMKKSFREKLFTRIGLLLRAKLNSKSLFTAINIWAIPSMAYSFGVINWSATELRSLDREVRSILTKYGVHHPHSSTLRLYLPRHRGGRGLLSLEDIHWKSVSDLRQHFLKQSSPLFGAIREADVGLSALKLSEPEYQVPTYCVEERIEEWSAKALHGRYPSHLGSEEVDGVESLTYLRAGYLFPETEGRILAIQDQVVPTRMYMKHIAGQDIPSDRCRKCSQAAESIQHVTSSCPILAPRDYLERHNAMGKIYHQQIALKLGLLGEEVQQHLYKPKTLLENERYKLYWDVTLVTDRGVAHNRPDVALFDKQEQTCLLLDFTVPADDNLARAYSEKISKYSDLAYQLRDVHNLKAISILPLIISVNGLVEKHLPDNTARLCLDPTVISSSQKQVLLSAARMVRKFLQGP